MQHEEMVDQAQGQAVPADGQSEEILNEMTNVLAGLEEQPDNVRLLRRQIHLLRRLDLVEELVTSVERLMSLVMLSEGEATSKKKTLLITRPVDGLP